MGIQGLLSFVTENGLTSGYRLHDTALVVSGLNLENELYAKYLCQRKDLPFGGDYAHFAAYVRSFFDALLACGITPIVIMDGSFESSKLDAKKERFDRRLKTAVAVFSYRSTHGEEINSLLNPFIFVDVIKQMGIRCFQAVYEAKELIPQIAFDLECPILTGSSDYFLYDLSAGVVLIKPLLVNDFRVNKSADGQYNYIDCKLFHVDDLKRKFSGLRSEMIPLAGVVLGDKYLEYNQAKSLISKLPRPPIRYAKFRQSQIHSVFSWLAHQFSYESAVAALIRFSANKLTTALNRPLGVLLKSEAQSDVSKVELSTIIDEYFNRNSSYLFKHEPDVPSWAHDLLVDSRMQKRLISILLGRVEFFRPLVEDFSMPTSSYDCCFKLCANIYGILRASNRPLEVTRFVRQGYRRQEQTVMPTLQIGTYELPMFEEIGQMEEQERLELFFRMIEFGEEMVEGIEKIIQQVGINNFDQSKMQGLKTMLISMVYFTRHYSGSISIEFIYSLLINVIMMGYFTSEGNVTLFEFEDRKSLSDKLAQFDNVPSLEDYQPRLVHWYNSFQNCLHNIHFLAQILNLCDSHFGVVHFFAGLEGTFIYNLAKELLASDTPLAHLESDILTERDENEQEQKGKPYLKLFSNLLDLVLEQSERKYYSVEASGDVALECKDRMVVPISLLTNTSTTDNHLFVRGIN